MNRGGEDVGFEDWSGRERCGGEGTGWVCWLTGELGPSVAGVADSAWGSLDSRGESLRFLWEDVVTVKALLPEGNKA